MSWNNVIPAWMLGPEEPCFICKHKYASHRSDIGCLGPFNKAEDASSFYAGTCKKGCKKYIKDNLEYLAWKHSQKGKKKNERE